MEKVLQGPRQAPYNSLKAKWIAQAAYRSVNRNLFSWLSHNLFRRYIQHYPISLKFAQIFFNGTAKKEYRYLLDLVLTNYRRADRGHQQAF